MKVVFHLPPAFLHKEKVLKYSLYFVAKNLAMAEKQEKVAFYDYAGPFFLLWFFFIGVWVIQPRINKMFASEPAGQPPEPPGPEQ